MIGKSHFMVGTAFAFACAPAAMAQTAPDSDEQNQPELAEQVESQPDTTIVVTGSYIRGQREDGAQPVDVFGQEELEARGIDSPLEFIKSLPSVGPVLGDSNQYGAGQSQGVGSINLRSLGRERTRDAFPHDAAWALAYGALVESFWDLDPPGITESWKFPAVYKP